MEKGSSSVTGVGADASNAPVEVYTLGGVKVGSRSEWFAKRYLYNQARWHSEKSDEISLDCIE